MMKKYFFRSVFFLMIMGFCASSVVFAQGYSGLNADPESQYLQEINDMAQKIQGYKHKVAVLKRQKDAIEDKFYELQAQRDYLYRKNIAEQNEKQVLQDKVKYLTQIYRQKLDQRDQYIHNKIAHYNQMKDMLLYELYQGNELQIDPSEMTQKTKAELQEVRGDLASKVGMEEGYENEISQLSKEYNGYKKRMIKKDALDEHMIDALEDNLEVKKGKIQDLRSDLVSKELDLVIQE